MIDSRPSSRALHDPEFDGFKERQKISRQMERKLIEKTGAPMCRNRGDSIGESSRSSSGGRFGSDGMRKFIPNGS